MTAGARGRWPEAALAAVAVLASGWSITGLLATQPWVGPAASLLAVVAVVGGLARTARLPAWAVVGAQVVLSVLVLTWVLLPGTHRAGLPTTATTEAAVALWAQGAETIRTETVPAPATDGLVLIVVAGLALVGVIVDVLAVTARSPAAAGIPLLVVSTVTASSTGQALHPKYFLAAALAWLVMLAHQGIGSVRSWPSPAATTVDEAAAVASGTRRYGAQARLVGAATALLAVGAAGFLPHLPPTTVLDGLARAGGGDVTFTETLDLAADLGSRSNRPVLRYRTDEARPSPLKVTAAIRYADGRWQPEDPDAPAGRDPGPAGAALDPAVQVRTWSVTVVENMLRAPQVAVPTPLLDVDLGDLPWRPVPRTGSVVVAEQPETYDASAYRTVGALPDAVGLGPSPDLGIPELLELDEASADRVRDLTALVTAGATSQLDAATRIQGYLRSSPFTYSLTLADPVPGPDGEPLDPISHFLQTQQGYCTQFATAMVMMARAWNIPARLAVGFLPGDAGADGTFTVVAADAHAWPELYIDGLGWTRFEPTPATRSGLAPVYYRQADLTAADEPAAPVQPAPEPEPAASGPATEAGRTTTGNGSSFGEVAARAAAVLGRLAAVATVVCVVPLAGWWRRTARLRRARDDAERVEGHWSALTSALADLGVTAPASTTPRQARHRYATALPDAAVDALDRATRRLEQVRYTPAGALEGSMAEDVRTVLRAARRQRPYGTRLRARLLPASGLAQLAAVAAHGRKIRRATARHVRALVPRSDL